MLRGSGNIGVCSFLIPSIQTLGANILLKGIVGRLAGPETRPTADEQPGGTGVLAFKSEWLNRSFDSVLFDSQESIRIEIEFSGSVGPFPRPCYFPPASQSKRMRRSAGYSTFLPKILSSASLVSSAELCGPFFSSRRRYS